MAESAKRAAATDNIDHWIEAILSGEPRALGRMLSLIEARAPLARMVLQRLYPRTGTAHVIGITGAAGSGKSTLIARLAAAMRRRDKQVGILTVDPTSPLTGGALLGDRLRMREMFLDKGVFIRSLASRGQGGGVASALHESVQLLDAAGKDAVFVETIGIGQDQVDIASVAETVVLVLTPECGDEVQAMKAGIVELADLWLINKADLPGAGVLRGQLLNGLELAADRLFLSSALDGQGVTELLDGVLRHRVQLRAAGQHQRRLFAGAQAQLLATLRDLLMARLEKQLPQRDLNEWTRKIADRRIDAHSAAKSLLEDLERGEAISPRRPEQHEGESNITGK